MTAESNQPPRAKTLYVTPQGLRVVADRKHRTVGVLLDLDDNAVGLLGIKVAIGLSPQDARGVALELLKKADEAEVGYKTN